MENESETRGFQADLVDRTNDAPLNTRKNYNNWKVFFGMIPVLALGAFVLYQNEKSDQRTTLRYLQEDVLELKADLEQGFKQRPDELQKDIASAIAALKEDRPYHITSNEIYNLERQFSTARKTQPTNAVIRDLDKPIQINYKK